MASVISPRSATDLQSGDRLHVCTSDGGSFYLAVPEDQPAGERWLVVTALDDCTCAGIHKILTSCKATGCGSPVIRLVSTLAPGASICLWVDHKVHGSPRSHSIKHVTISSVKIVKPDDIESTEVSP